MRNTKVDEKRIGTIVDVMCVGHVVRAKVVGTKMVYEGSPAGDPALYEYDCEFICHRESGAGELCLDFGQDWYIKAGEKFSAGERAIAVAAEWIEKEKPTANEIAARIRANINEWFNYHIPDEIFRKCASDIWDQARALGIHDDVLEIVCPKL